MYNPKPEIYQKLSEIEGVSVLQSSQNEFTSVPAVTYRIDGQTGNYDLDNQLYRQDILVTIDIFTDDSVTASHILENVEAKMRDLNFRLSTAIDVPQPEGALFHKNASFEGIR